MKSVSKQSSVSIASGTNTKTIVMTAFFAAIIFCGIQAFRIPMPAAVGTPFLHFGHIFVLLAIFTLGPIHSTIASVAGYLIFDLLNGYTHAIPNVFVTTVVKCILVGILFMSLQKSEKKWMKEYVLAIFCAVIYGVLNIITDFLWSVAELMITGSTFQAAFAAELTSIPATIVNAVFAVIGIGILYLPVQKAYKRIIKNL